jgi:hypothetical protein
VEDDIVNVYFRGLLLTSASDDKFLELGAILGYLQDAAPDHFKMLLNTPELGRRKGYYLALVYKAFAKHANDGPTRLRLIKIGWTKLTVIAPHVTADNLDELLGLAEKHTVENLKAVMQGEEPLINGKVVVLRFTETQYTIFKEVLLKKGAIKNGDGIVMKEKALIKVLRKTMK